MATTFQKSVQLSNPLLLPPTNNETNVERGKLRLDYASFTQQGAGDPGSEIELVRLPPGRVRLLKNLALVCTSALGASRTLSIGNRAYNALDGSPVAQAPASILAATSFASAVSQSLANAAGADPTQYFESQTGIVIYALLAGGIIPDQATIFALFPYVTD